MKTALIIAILATALSSCTSITPEQIHAFERGSSLIIEILTTNQK